MKLAKIEFTQSINARMFLSCKLYIGQTEKSWKFATISVWILLKTTRQLNWTEIDATIRVHETISWPLFLQLCNMENALLFSIASNKYQENRYETNQTKPKPSKKFTHIFFLLKYISSVKMRSYTSSSFIWFLCVIFTLAVQMCYPWKHIFDYLIVIYTSLIWRYQSHCDRIVVSRFGGSDVKTETSIHIRERAREREQTHDIETLSHT